jgi:Bax protein
MNHDSALRAAPMRGAVWPLLFAALLLVAAIGIGQRMPRYAAPAPAAISIPDETPALIVDASRIARMAAGDLFALFVDRGYRLGEAKSGSEPVPRLVVAQLPGDLAALDSIDLRKSVFIKSLLPLLLLENERILADRTRLLDILEQGGPIGASQTAWLAELAERYETAPDRLRDLARRVDAVPVSLALAQAALESGWGTSRGAQNGHAPFGQMSFRADDDGRVRHFSDLGEAVEAYALNLNTHRAYGEFRRARAVVRAEGKLPDGHALAGHLQRYSERRMDYVRDVRSLMRVNGLRSLDNARLDL